MRGNCSSLGGRWYIQVCAKVAGRVKREACAAAAALPNNFAFGTGTPESRVLTLPRSTDPSQSAGQKKVFVRVEEGGNGPGDRAGWGSLPKAFHPFL